jgi:hypothetical protein
MLSFCEVEAELNYTSDYPCGQSMDNIYENQATSRGQKQKQPGPDYREPFGGGGQSISQRTPHVTTQYRNIFDKLPTGSQPTAEEIAIKMRQYTSSHQS